MTIVLAGFANTVKATKMKCGAVVIFNTCLDIGSIKINAEY